MTHFEEFKNMDIDALAEWLDEHGQFDNSPWTSWFDQKYCKNCEPVMCHYPNSTHEFPCSWCELNDNKCKYFPELAQIPSNKETIKMWLQTEVKE